MSKIALYALVTDGISKRSFKLPLRQSSIDKRRLASWNVLAATLPCPMHTKANCALTFKALGTKIEGDVEEIFDIKIEEEINYRLDDGLRFSVLDKKDEPVKYHRETSAGITTIRFEVRFGWGYVGNEWEFSEGGKIIAAEIWWDDEDCLFTSLTYHVATKNPLKKSNGDGDRVKAHHTDKKIFATCRKKAIQHWEYLNRVQPLVENMIHHITMMKMVP